MLVSLEIDRGQRPLDIGGLRMFNFSPALKQGIVNVSGNRREEQMYRKRKTEGRKKRKLKELEKKDISELRRISELKKDQMKNLSGASNAPTGIAQHPCIGDVP